LAVWQCFLQNFGVETDVSPQFRIGASKLALTGEASFVFPILLSKQTLIIKASFDAPVILGNLPLSHLCVTSVRKLASTA
jgi:hypothetical protein